MCIWTRKSALIQPRTSLRKSAVSWPEQLPRGFSPEKLEETALYVVDVAPDFIYAGGTPECDGNALRWRGKISLLFFVWFQAISGNGKILSKFRQILAKFS